MRAKADEVATLEPEAAESRAQAPTLVTARPPGSRDRKMRMAANSPDDRPVDDAT